eukprot:CAMPEP_0203760434 /NCGR_PEP_ID=MMETSP0098-20131031/13726_1 /ASSEMBLY_ACC=CAM_ASM_000208 /TAXON_ID=96639 /ORGANISM=" , Strain NY0313808BC1" /LENGTH=1038 /DNA_ID=CAMNT_0050653987 /DNA_START=44 /DNA_END=3157 /DNA_ORIENTATION=+
MGAKTTKEQCGDQDDASWQMVEALSPLDVSKADEVLDFDEVEKIIDSAPTRGESDQVPKVSPATQTSEACGDGHRRYLEDGQQKYQEYLRTYEDVREKKSVCLVGLPECIELLKAGKELPKDGKWFYLPPGDKGNHILRESSEALREEEWCPTGDTFKLTAGKWHPVISEEGEWRATHKKALKNMKKSEYIEHGKLHERDLYVLTAELKKKHEEGFQRYCLKEEEEERDPKETREKNNRKKKEGTNTEQPEWVEFSESETYPDCDGRFFFSGTTEHYAINKLTCRLFIFTSEEKDLPCICWLSGASGFFNGFKQTIVKHREKALMEEREQKRTRRHRGPSLGDDDTLGGKKQFRRGDDDNPHGKKQIWTLNCLPYEPEEADVIRAIATESSNIFKGRVEVRYFDSSETLKDICQEILKAIASTNDTIILHIVGKKEGNLIVGNDCVLGYKDFSILEVLQDVVEMIYLSLCSSKEIADMLAEECFPDAAIFYHEEELYCDDVPMITKRLYTALSARSHQNIRWDNFYDFIENDSGVSSTVKPPSMIYSVPKEQTFAAQMHLSAFDSLKREQRKEYEAKISAERMMEQAPRRTRRTVVLDEKQEEIRKIVETNFKESGPNAIIVDDTARSTAIANKIIRMVARDSTGKVVVCVAPTQTILESEAKKIEEETGCNIGRYFGRVSLLDWPTVHSSLDGIVVTYGILNKLLEEKSVDKVFGIMSLLVFYNCAEHREGRYGNIISALHEWQKLRKERLYILGLTVDALLTSGESLDDHDRSMRRLCAGYGFQSSDDRIPATVLPEETTRTDLCVPLKIRVSPLSSSDIEEWRKLVGEVVKEPCKKRLLYCLSEFYREMDKLTTSLLQKQPTAQVFGLALIKELRKLEDPSVEGLPVHAFTTQAIEKLVERLKEVDISSQKGKWIIVFVETKQHVEDLVDYLQLELKSELYNFKGVVGDRKTSLTGEDNVLKQRSHSKINVLVSTSVLQGGGLQAPCSEVIFLGCPQRQDGLENSRQFGAPFCVISHEGTIAKFDRLIKQMEMAK